MLVRIETSPDDFHGMAAAQGVLTAHAAAATSHAAVVARQIGKPCVAGCAALIIDYATRLTAKVDGLTSVKATGSPSTARPARCTSARCPTAARLRGPGRAPDGARVGRRVRRLEVWTNADKPEEAAQARGYGAQGIGLCRTEHMFREGERLDIVRDAILVAVPGHARQGKARRGRNAGAGRRRCGETFDGAMAKLEKLQEGDFYGIFEAMDGLPVVIRLIDPPLHEFLPNHERTGPSDDAGQGRPTIRNRRGA